MGCCFSKRPASPPPPPPLVPVKPSQPPFRSNPVQAPTPVEPPSLAQPPHVRPPPPGQTPPVVAPPPSLVEPSQPPFQQPPGQPPLPAQPPLPTVENCISFFQKIKKAEDVDYLIDLIDELLKSLLNRSKQEKTSDRSISSETHSDTLKDRAKSIWTSFLQSGSAFLEFVNTHIQLEKGDESSRKVVAQILHSVGNVHWVAAGLSVVAFLLDQSGQISENRSECIELLRQMAKLAGHIRKLKYDMPQEEKILNEAIILIVEGSMMCASQLHSRALFRFLKASVDSQSLRALQQKIDQVYQDLTLRVITEIQHQQPVAFPPWKPIYPYYAVGIDQQKEQVMALLDMEPRKKSILAVVVYGFGGIGKTTLAAAVIAGLDLKDYNYSGIQIQEDRSRNDIKSMQQQILKDAFPAYTYERNVTLRNSSEGRDHLTNAFRVEGNKPVFLFIDTALRAEDLQELFPKRLAGLPKRSRIVITTRNLGETDVLLDAGLTRREHIVDTLPPEEASKILFGDFNPDNSKDREKMQKTLEICAGIPLVLEIVGARLRKQNYMVERCTQIIEALERGRAIKEENLSDRLVNFVYDKLETSTQEAFLDICCFFPNWSRRHVEYIVGAEEVTHLEEAALFKTSNKGKVVVHDIIRAKGLSLSESNRIMDMQSWLDIVASETQRLDQIKGVWLSREETEPAYELDENHIFSMKKSLRVLILGNQINLSRSSQKTPKFKELRLLRLGGDISALWPVKEQKSLQRLPEWLDHLTGLKVLILDGWDKMQELSEQVCGQASLCYLRICCASSLKNLPKSFGQLSSLQEVTLRSCTQLEEFPLSFGDLSSLKHVNLADCVSLKELPSSFGKLSSLEVLNLESCWKLGSLPSTFGQLRRLKKLSLQSYDLKELPSSFGGLSSLVELNLSGCLELKELPDSIGQLTSLTHLDLSCCTNLKTLPSSVGELLSVKDFNLFACFKLEKLPSTIEKLPCLMQLDLRRCNNLKERPKFPSSRQRDQGLTILLPDHLMGKESSSSNRSSE